MYTIPHLTSPFFFNHTATTDIYTLSLHDALPISAPGGDEQHHRDAAARARRVAGCQLPPTAVLCGHEGPDRKSTRLNSSHVKISYAVFCLKKKKQVETGAKNHKVMLRSSPTIIFT